MEFNQKVKMSINNWRDFQDEEDVSLAYGKVTFLSTKPNSHKHFYSEEVLKTYAPSYLGKFVVTEFDKLSGDVSTHTENQTIVGYIPTNQELVFDRDEEGYLQVTADVVISKIYAPEVYKLFKSNNFRSVSVEELVGFTEETKNFEDGVDEKIVEGFEGIGITILGLQYKPSVPTANIKLVRMSKDNVKNIEKEYVEYTEKVNVDKNIDMEKILEKLESIEDKLQRKENKMTELKEKEVLADKGKDKKMVEKENKEKMSKEVVEEKMEDDIDNEKDQDDKNDVDDRDEEEMVCDKTEKMQKIEEELSQIKMELKQKEKIITDQLEELKELKQYKKDVEMAQKQNIVSETLAKVSKYSDEETLNKFKISAESCKFSEINGWKNEVLASITDKILMSTQEEEGIMNMGLPIIPKTEESIYD